MGRGQIALINAETRQLHGRRISRSGRFAPPYPNHAETTAACNGVENPDEGSSSGSGGTEGKLSLNYSGW